MELIQQLLDSEKLRFLIVGGLNTALGFGLFAFFNWTFSKYEFGYMIALVLSQIISLFFAFWLHKTFTFKTAGHLWQDFIRFTMVNSVNYVINWIALPILVHGMHMNPLIGQLIVLIVTTVLSFVGHKYFSFKR